MDAIRSSQVPSGMATVVGNSVFLSITTAGVDLPGSAVGVDLPGKRMTLLGEGLERPWQPPGYLSFAEQLVFSFLLH